MLIKRLVAVPSRGDRVIGKRIPRKAPQRAIYLGQARHTRLRSPCQPDRHGLQRPYNRLGTTGVQAQDSAPADTPQVRFMFVANEARRYDNVRLVPPEFERALGTQDSQEDFLAHLLAQHRSLLASEPNYGGAERRCRGVHGTHHARLAAV